MIEENTSIFDFETTGLDPKTDQVIEIAIVRIREGKEIGSFSYLVNPGIPIPKKITEITGIRTEDVVHCPTIEQLLPWVMAMFGDSLLIAHNALFDLGFLEVLNQRYRKRAVRNSFLDTRAICIDRFPYESHRLDLMCEKYSIPLEGAHRALNDVHATWELAKKMHQEIPIEESYINRATYFKKYGPPAWTPDYATLVGI